MDKYIGKFRVVNEFDRNNLEPIKHDTYIDCRSNGQIYRYNGNTLAYYKPTRSQSESFCGKLRDLNVKNVVNRSSDEDLLVYFAEESLDIIAEYVGASTSGADIPPSSVKNLKKLKWFKDNKQYYIDNGYYRKPKELTEEEKEVLRERFRKTVLDK